MPMGVSTVKQFVPLRALSFSEKQRIVSFLSRFHVDFAQFIRVLDIRTSLAK